MARSQYIFGRVQRALNRLGYPNEQYTPEDIYDAIHLGQCELLGRLKPDLELEITLAASTSEYSLLITGLETNENIFGKVISCIVPTTWSYDLDFVSEKEWKEVTRKISGTSQPLKASIFNNTLYLHPAPSTTGEKLTLFIAKLGPSTRISASVEPETDVRWDPALGYFATHEISGDKDSLTKFENQYAIHKGTRGYRGLPRQRKADPVLNAN